MGDRTEHARFVQALAPALRQAASIARALEGRVANRPKSGEASDAKAALTIADSAAQEALLVPLLEHFPGVSLAAEEDTPTVSCFPEASDDLVVIDPIDGTLRFYLEGGGSYAVMIGLARHGVYRAALVALPRERLFLDAFAGGGARVAVGDARPGPARFDPAARRVFVSHGLPEAALDSLRASGLEPEAACGGAIAVAPLLTGYCGGLRFADVEGIGVSIRGRIGALISAEAGALLRGEGGEDFPLDLTSRSRLLLVARDEEVLAALERAANAAL